MLAAARLSPARTHASPRLERLVDLALYFAHHQLPGPPGDLALVRESTPPVRFLVSLSNFIPPSLPPSLSLSPSLPAQITPHQINAGPTTPPAHHGASHHSLAPGRPELHIETQLIFQLHAILMLGLLHIHLLALLFHRRLICLPRGGAREEGMEIDNAGDTNTAYVTPLGIQEKECLRQHLSFPRCTSPTQRVHRTLASPVS